MKKSFLALPIAVAVLAACGSNNSAPIENADGTLSPGIMQPVDGSGATAGGSWEPQIQQGGVPATMNTPSAQPTYQPVQQPTQPAFQPVQQPAQPTYQPVQPAPAKAVAPKKVDQNFTIPRNPTTNAPDYSQIDKGFYKGDTYTVRKGDTMFLIAYIAGIDVKELARLNNMSEPYSISVGQTLKVSNGARAAPAATQTAVAAQPAQPAQPAEEVVTYRPGANGTQYGSDGTITGPIKAGVGGVAPARPVNTGVVATVGTPTSVQPAQPVQQEQAPAVSNVNFAWPTNGNVVQGFSNADGGNKGIDIAGSRGQAVNAAAAGRVVYAGNALRGYGNLIIIKHNDDFLSAYAHNETILVKDQQQVSAGQQIAKMGSSGTNGVKLHFEIRYKGKSVDPQRYLPRR